jgi:16S rRNA (cytidine1402-2'-O)-methyltransferase
MQNDPSSMGADDAYSASASDTADIAASAAGVWPRLAERVATQHWPASTLYVVATPIGNLGDLSLRAQMTLQRCDVIAAEDTRSTRPMLEAWGIRTPLMAAHRHNEAQAAQAIVGRLAAGERVALVSDAGAPGVSDPGARVVRAVREAGFTVVPIPGASAVIAALMGSGVTTDENPAFVFAGFAPSKRVARQRWLAQWTAVPAPVVIYESPHRLRETLRDVVETCGAGRQITIARELSKRFEEIVTLPASEALTWIDAPHREQGEFVLIVGAPPEQEETGIDGRAGEILQWCMEVTSVRDAARLASRITGVPRDALYAHALTLRKAQEDEEEDD